MSGNPTSGQQIDFKELLKKYWFLVVLSLLLPFPFIFMLLFVLFISYARKGQPRRKALAGLPVDGSKEVERLTRTMDLQPSGAL